MLRPLRSLVSAIAVITLSACGGGSSSPAAPVTSIAGNYTGTVHDNLAGAGAATLNLTQSGSTLGGTFADSFSSSSENNSGSVAGTISGASVQLTLTSGQAGDCPYFFTGTIAGTTISGTYTTQSCSVANGGTLSASLH